MNTRTFLRTELRNAIHNLRKRLANWIDPDIYYTDGVSECIRYGLPRLTERYGDSSPEVLEAIRMEQAMSNE